MTSKNSDSGQTGHGLPVKGLKAGRPRGGRVRLVAIAVAVGGDDQRHCHLHPDFAVGLYGNPAHLLTGQPRDPRASASGQCGPRYTFLAFLANETPFFHVIAEQNAFPVA